MSLHRRCDVCGTEGSHLATWRDSAKSASPELPDGWVLFDIARYPGSRGVYAKELCPTCADPIMRTLDCPEWEPA